MSNPLSVDLSAGQHAYGMLAFRGPDAASFLQGQLSADVESLASGASALAGFHNPQGRTIALLTDMNTPLGRTGGNALEVTESVEVLAGGGPADVVELTLALAREMLDAAGLPDADPAEALRDGRAMDSWRRMIAAQGGDPSDAGPSLYASSAANFEAIGPMPAAAHRVLCTDAPGWRAEFRRTARDLRAARARRPDTLPLDS